MENFLFPDEIVLKILGYLGLGQLIQCARVSKSLNNICKDRSLSYRSSMIVMKKLTVKVRKSIVDILIARPQVEDHNSILDILIANPEVKEVILRNPSICSETRNKRVRTQDSREHEKAAVHYVIFRNKLVLQVFYLHLNASNDPYLRRRL